MKLLIVLFVAEIALTSAMFNSELTDNHPYMAYVTFIGPQMSFYGGGALISTTHVLTCAANIQGFTAWRVGLGSNRRVNHLTLPSQRAVAHPNYAEANNVRVNDIGIIFLDQPVNLTVSIFPIFLPPLVGPSQPFANIQSMVLGFAGSQSVGTEGEQNMQAAHVRTTVNATCLELYPTHDMNQHFCAVDTEKNSNFCLGDQGGPVTIVTRGEEFLIGLASLPGCTTRPSLYSRITPYRQWINQQIGI